MRISYTAIGRNIRALRQQAGLTQEAVAEMLKISHLHYGRLERGERPISLDMIANIADTLGGDASALMAGCFVGQSISDAYAVTRKLGDAIAALAAGCSEQARRLMLAVCREIALSDKGGAPAADGE